MRSNEEMIDGISEAMHELIAASLKLKHAAKQCEALIERLCAAERARKDFENE